MYSGYLAKKKKKKKKKFTATVFTSQVHKEDTLQ